MATFINSSLKDPVERSALCASTGKSENRKRIRVNCEKIKGGRKYTACSVKKAREVLGCSVSVLETDQLARDPVEKGQVEKREGGGLRKIKSSSPFH